MTPEEDRKLQDAFYRKFRHLAFEERSFRSALTWPAYLKSHGCINVPDGESAKGDWEIIHDPSPFGGYILVPQELALKILAIGLP